MPLDGLRERAPRARRHRPEQARRAIVGARYAKDELTTRIVLQGKRTQILLETWLVAMQGNEQTDRRQVFDDIQLRFAPSEASYKVAIEFYERGRARLAAAGVTDTSDFDLFTALIAGLADQQVANDPGGDRWIRLTDRVLTMFFAYLDSTRKAPR